MASAYISERESGCHKTIAIFYFSSAGNDEKIFEWTNNINEITLFWEFHFNLVPIFIEKERYTKWLYIFLFRSSWAGRVAQCGRAANVSIKWEPEWSHGTAEADSFARPHSQQAPNEIARLFYIFSFALYGSGVLVSRVRQCECKMLFFRSKYLLLWLCKCSSPQTIAGSRELLFGKLSALLFDSDVRLAEEKSVCL